MSWPYSPRTRIRPIGPGSPMPLSRRPRAFLAGGRSLRSGRWPSRVWTTNIPSLRAVSSTRWVGGRQHAGARRRYPTPRRSPGIDEIALHVDHQQRGRFGSNSNSYGSAGTVGMCPPDQQSDRAPSPSPSTLCQYASVQSIGSDPVRTSVDDLLFTPSPSASSRSAAAKQASGARAMPAPIWPIPGSRWAIPVLMTGPAAVDHARSRSPSACRRIRAREGEVGVPGQRDPCISRV